jgi:EmrB/QacA subfamily drug resistance transporter
VPHEQAGKTAPVEYSAATKRIVLVVSLMTSFLTPFLVSSVNIALPAIGKEYSLNAIMLSWVVTAYLLSTVILLVPFGRIADIVGRKKIYMTGTLIITISSLIAANARSITMLLAARSLEGLGGAMIFGTGIAMLISVYPLRERGKVLGINVAGTYLGLSLGPVIGGWLTDSFGWRSIFMLVVPYGILILSLLFWKVKYEWTEARGESFDLPGALLYGLAILVLMYDFTRLPSAIGFVGVLCGIVLLVLFVSRELRTDFPVLNMQIFRHNMAFTFSNLAAMINYSATYALAFMLSLYLQYIKGLDAHHAGYILIFQPLVMFLFSPFAGRLSDRVEPRLVASAGMGITVVGLALLVGLNRNTSLGYIIGTLLLIGLGFGLFSSPNTNAVMSSVEKKFYGVASGTLGTMRMTGQMLSMGIVTMIMAIFLGQSIITPGKYPLFINATKTTFTAFAIICAFGVLASLARGKVHADHQLD